MATDKIYRGIGMTRLDNLYQLAEDEDIDIYAFPLPLSGSVSTMDTNGTCYIGIDPFALDTYADETVRLAHELGHCMTGSFYNIYSSCDIRARHERKAKKWAIKKLVPKDELKDAVESGLTELWELSEYFDLPAAFMAEVIEYYHEQSQERSI